MKSGKMSTGLWIGDVVLLGNSIMLFLKWDIFKIVSVDKSHCISLFGL